MAWGKTAGRKHEQRITDAQEARLRGDAFYRVTLPESEFDPALLAGVEASGWRLEHVGYATNIATINGSGTSSITAVYLFRAA